MIDPDCNVLTWNLWWRFGDWRARQPLIAEVVAATDADVVALQESWREGAIGQPEQLVDAAGLSHVAWSANRQPDRWRSRLSNASSDLDCGLAILSRWPMIEIEEIDLPAGAWPSDGRTALAVLIEHPRGPLPVVTTHLDSHPARSALRVEQLDAVATLVDNMITRAGDSGLAPIVCGDMNAEPHSDEVRRFGGLQTAPHIEDLAFQDVWQVGGPDDDPGWTWRKDNPHLPSGSANARIDYVFLGLGGRVAAAKLVGVGSGSLWPSDHAGVLGNLRP